MILVRSSIPVVRMSELETNCEIVWVKLLTSPSHLLFGVFYCPPGPSLSAMDELNSSLSLINGGTPLVLCGDLMFPQSTGQWFLQLYHLQPLLISVQLHMITFSISWLFILLEP